MKSELHPAMHLIEVVCTCGNSFQTHSTAERMHVEICSNCHPFYTGTQKMIDTGGRVERFQRILAKTAAKNPGS